MSIPTADQVRRAIPKAIRPWVTATLRAADERDCGVLLVGGPVRDLLLGRPLGDVDLAVEPPPGKARPGAPQLARAIDWGDATLRAHPRFGTAQVEDGARRLDLATVRNERYDAPGLLPVVSPGTLETDLRRRDFTINAMAIPLNAAARRGGSALVDPTGGRADLDGGRLRGRGKSVPLRRGAGSPARVL